MMILPSKTAPGLLASAVALAFLLAGCDATGPSETVILNANSPVPPTVEYTFRYTTDGSGSLEVASQESDDLGSVLGDNGFSRSDVRSARIDSVLLERKSSTKTVPPKPKLFTYLSEITVFLSPDATAPRIASATIDPSFAPEEKREIRSQVMTRDVTEVVKNGSTKASLKLNTDDTSGRQDKIDMTLYLRLELEGA